MTPRAIWPYAAEGARAQGPRIVRLKRRAIAAAVILAVGGSVGRLRVNFTRSLPLGVYRVADAGPIVRGSIVLVCLPEQIARFARDREYLWRGTCPGAAAPVGKLVLALAGDTVRVTKYGLCVNGRLVPGTAPMRTDSQGRVVVHYPDGLYAVARNEMWLYSPYHPRSFDSRYFGPVPTVNVRFRMFALWTNRSD